MKSSRSLLEAVGAADIADAGGTDRNAMDIFGPRCPCLLCSSDLAKHLESASEDFGYPLRPGSVQCWGSGS